MKEENRAFRKEVLSRFLVDFTEWHRPFLQELAERYKARGRFPYYPIRDLALSYVDDCDKEVAALAGVLVAEGAKSDERVRAFRIMMGDSPYEWFVKRSFAMVATGDNQTKRTGGMTNWKIARYFDYLYKGYNGCFERTQNLPLTIMTAVGKTNYLYRLQLLRLIMCTTDGMGLGLWQNTRYRVKCPDSFGVRQFVKLWFPEIALRGMPGGLFSYGEVIRLLGFEREYDFFYAYLGWEELCRRNPKECSRYVTVYNKRYSEGNKQTARYWTGDRRILPDIDF